MATLGKGFVDALKEGVQKSGEKDTKAFAKALDNMQRNVSGVANLFRGSELVTSLVVRDQLSSTVFNSSVGWQVKGDGSATFRNVTVSGGSLLITNTTDRIHLQSDGDAFFGSNIAAPATTSLSIFSNAQTYNSEAMGAGDVLFGDNSTGKANLLWDASTGKILLRGGTTTQGYFDTDGSATFGAGSVILDADGIQIATPASGFTDKESIRFIAGPTTGSDPGYWHQLAVRHVNDAPTSIAYARSDTVGDAGAWYQISTRENVLTAGLNALITANALTTAYVELQAGTPAGTYNSVFVNQASTVFNEDGIDADFIVEGDTATSLLILDAGLDAVQIGTTVAGAIADFRAAAIVFNEASNDVDFRVESNGNANAITVDGGTDLVGILRAPASGDAALTVLGDMQASDYTGWNFANETWTYASASTFTVPTDLTAKYQKGTKIKLTQTTAKYFYVTASSYSNPNTTVTVTGGSDYTLANAAITSPFYSYIENPQGFPGSFAYTPTYTGFSADPTAVARFSVSGRICFVYVFMNAAGTSNAAGFTTSLPVASANLAGMVWWGGAGSTVNNSVQEAEGFISVAANGTAITNRRTADVNWTTSGTKKQDFNAAYHI